MKKTIHFLLISLALSAMLACDEASQVKSNISGRAGEIVVIYDIPLWDTLFVKEVKSIIALPYPALPQQEPIFDIISIPSSSFGHNFKIHRNLVFMQIMLDTIPARIVVKHDVWAIPQTVVHINASTREELLALLQQEQTRFINIMEQAERDRVIGNSKKYEAKDLRDIVNPLFGGSPYFPNGYRLRKKTDNFVWIDYEIQKAQIGIFVYKYPYKDTTTFKTENIIARRNEILKQEVPGAFENTYMTTTTVLPPISRNVLYNKIHFVETRGLWEVENDFMGGPFISHSFFAPSGKEIIVLEAYVYNPRSEKRNFLRQVESIIYSFEWEENQ
ncbi:MAG: DUF4837 family protein [Prevotellaceae bacterium]|jgi:hypothetical protein|nr:DUF4837 family protein [Prevotellaceae bacterium]